ncbi:MAG: hypothetical protein ACK5N0_06530 [Synechococcaceae cyanobacterium]
MAEMLLLLVAFGLLALVWYAFDSDDDNGGGGLMQPVLIPIRSQPRR